MVHVTRRATRILLAVLLVPFVWLMANTPAFAHDELVSTTPSSGATVTAPTTVQLKFSDTVVSTGSRVQVKDPSQKVVSGDLSVSGDTVSVTLASPAVAGTYRVVWRVTSADGHPVSGNFDFTATVASTSSTSTPPGTSSASPPSSAAPSTGASSTSQSTPVPTQQVPTNDTNNEPGWILGAVAVAALAIGVGVVISRRRLTDDEPADGPTGEDD